MRKLILFTLCLVPVFANAQETHYNQKIDSTTYQYYLNGDWDRLIDSVKVALKKNVDFKYLRQRLGYAYFIKGDYFASQKQYEKALKFDERDIDTRTYLYYCGIYKGNDVYARLNGGQLPINLQQNFRLKQFKPVSAVDFEYNYKSNNSLVRGNPTYYRIGISTDLNYRFNLYQSFSTYVQTNKSNYIETNELINVATTDSSSIRQTEYFVLLNWAIHPHINFNIGYHYLNAKTIGQSTYSYTLGTQQYKTVIDSTTNFPGNMFCSKLTYSLNRFNLSISASVLKYDTLLTRQYGIQAGYIFPGKRSPYLKSSLYTMLDGNTKRLIFNQTAGAMILKKLWISGDIYWGNLKNYNDNNGLYLYNSLDPTTFRTGLSLFWYLSPKITLFGNYTFDIKNIEDSNTNYNQHSFSSGIIWKL